MKYILKISIPFLIAILSLISCSSDDSGFQESDVNNGTAKIEISNNTGNGITINLQGEFGNPSQKQIFYGIRKKGTTTYKRYPIKEVVVIDDLSPATAYEIKLVYDNSGLEETIRINVEDFFTNNLFNFTEESNTETALFKGLTIYSEEKFAHILYKSDQFEDSDVEIYLVDKLNPTDSIQALDIKITKEYLGFTIPDGLVSDVPYVPYKDYVVGLKARGKYHYPLSSLGIVNKEPLDKMVLRVVNTTPHIESIVNINHTINSGNCSGEEYTIVFDGYFMTTDAVPLNFMPGLTLISSAVMTRISDGKQYIIDDPTTNTVSDCMAYDRQYVSVQQDIQGFPRFHYARTAALKIPLSTAEDITKGDYKVKFTFDKDGVFYETNEFEFTLE